LFFFKEGELKFLDKGTHDWKNALRSEYGGKDSYVKSHEKSGNNRKVLSEFQEFGRIRIINIGHACACDVTERERKRT